MVNVNHTKLGATSRVLLRISLWYTSGSEVNAQPAGVTGARGSRVRRIGHTHSYKQAERGRTPTCPFQVLKETLSPNLLVKQQA